MAYFKVQVMRDQFRLLRFIQVYSIYLACSGLREFISSNININTYFYHYDCFKGEEKTLSAHDLPFGPLNYLFTDLLIIAPLTPSSFPLVSEMGYSR